MLSKTRLASLLLGIVVLGLGSAAGRASAVEMTRSFPDQKFRYTLPGEGWGWVDEKKVRGATFFASHGNGIGVIVTVVKAPAAPPVQKDFEDYVEGFEEAFHQQNGLTKRASRFMTFRGLPAYQINFNTADGRSAVIRTFMAHGLAYQLSVVGGLDPVEDTPGFESFMEGFEFTDSPTRGVASGDGGLTKGPQESQAYRMGQVAAECFVVVVPILVLIWVIFRRKSGSRRSPRASETTEDPEPREDPSSIKGS